jgi:RND family efflux transporter MFP subunit
LAEEVAQPWLALHCQSIAGARLGLVLQGAAGAPKPLAVWPKDEADGSDLVGVARAALAQGEVVVREHDQPLGSARCWSHVAVPFGAGSRFGGAVAIRVEHAEDAADLACERAVAQLRAGAAWLEETVRDASSRQRLVTALDTVASALENERLSAAATAVATELAHRLGCERVAIGIARRGRMQLEGLSDTARFDARSGLAGDLEAAMDEAADQDAPVCHPPQGESAVRVSMAHEALSTGHGSGLVWTVPLGSAGQTVGAITFERSEPDGLDEATLELCEDLGALLGPVFDLQRRARESWLEQMRERLSRLLARLRGPGEHPLKAGVAGGALLLLLLLFFPASYRVTADATLEGRVQRAIVAGVEGYIAEANVRAGDLIAEGQVMARFDDRDLLLERRNWKGKLAQLVKEHRKALAEHDRSQVAFLSARIDQAEAEIDLLDAQVGRTELLAPFDGVVVKGDLSQALGSPVERGELLFEVAPLDGYRIILKVDQSDIAAPAEGQQGALALTALPGKTLPLTVERITPVSIAEDGRNYFRVEAHLDEPVPGLRPGMEGVAKIDVGHRSLLWIWTHGLTDWLRLKTWTLLP